jgi:transposase
LPAGHLARFVIETVNQLDLSDVYGYHPSGWHGRPAFDPAMMVALVLYNYVGVRSSRVIERRCVEDVACRVIAVNQQPDHATIARFRVRHQDTSSSLFFDVLALCQRAGMVRGGTVAVDSTKLAADASMGQNRTLERLREQVRGIVQEAEEIDPREDGLYGDRGGDELPDDLADPATRRQRITELSDQARAKEAQAEAEHQERIDRRLARERAAGRRLAGRRPRTGLSVEERRKLESKSTT